MPRVGRVQVAVEIVDDDGSTTIHEAIGKPWEHRAPSISLTPSHDANGIPDLVMVSIDVGLVAVAGSNLFTVDTTPPPPAEVEPARPQYLQIEESPR
ncbi:hypothetical protein SEA_MEMENTOMORI_10 [Microbacterium phage MementoMori]|uniref:Uncharacterized protein n=1 Tax=Microbacterium phage MementoMori TaxID=2201436 RepID=A0A2Z4Q5S8_9CAUD|nr:hypothetical protein HOT41_gp10 [Microbacterium phage MementoMori]AWY05265.1 hypothetical protein SEA_MEMENTOMORI_10 [Microbacterium phage MementoMori]